METAEALPAQSLVLITSDDVPMYDEFYASSTLMDFHKVKLKFLLAAFDYLHQICHATAVDILLSLILIRNTTELYLQSYYKLQFNYPDNKNLVTLT